MEAALQWDLIPWERLRVNHLRCATCDHGSPDAPPDVSRGNRIDVRGRSAQDRPGDRFASGAVVVASWANKSSGRRILEGVDIPSIPDQARPNPAASSEDWRGVDIAQIRRQIQMTPAERLRHMTQVTNQMRRIQRAAHRGR